MTRPAIRLLPLAEIASDPGLPAWLADQLRVELGLDASVGETVTLRPEWLDAGRGQYGSNPIVDALVAAGGDRASARWVLALTDADLFAPGRDFVFGEAAQGGAWAVLGLHRLAHPEISLFRLRALKEGLHEIGHLAGLDHCPHPDCVMSASRTVADVDRKQARFCAACAPRMPGAEPP